MPFVNGPERSLTLCGQPFCSSVITKVHSLKVAGISVHFPYLLPKESVNRAQLIGVCLSWQRCVCARNKKSQIAARQGRPLPKTRYSGHPASRLSRIHHKWHQTNSLSYYMEGKHRTQWAHALVSEMLSIVDACGVFKGGWWVPHVCWACGTH